MDTKQEKTPELKYPEKMTMAWLFHNAPLRFWGIELSIIAGTFTAGIWLSEIITPDILEQSTISICQKEETKIQKLEEKLKEKLKEKLILIDEQANNESHLKENKTCGDPILTVKEKDLLTSKKIAIYFNHTGAEKATSIKKQLEELGVQDIKMISHTNPVFTPMIRYRTGEDAEAAVLLKQILQKQSIFVLKDKGFSTSSKETIKIAI